MFNIATNTAQAAPIAKSAVIEDSQVVRFTSYTLADRAKRQIIEIIESIESIDALEEYMIAEDLMIDAIFMFDNAMSEDIREAYKSQKAYLHHGQASVVKSGSAPAKQTATAQSPKPEKRKTNMFATNQSEGSMGPWMTWSSNGSAQKGFPPKTWIKRGKDSNDNKFEEVIIGFAEPCVFDVDSLKLGWEKDGATGQAPERKYSAHFSQPMQRPDESKKQNGAYAWSNCLQVRVAISQDEAVTWEQGSFGAYQAFTKLSKLIEAQWDQSQNGKLLPVVQMTGVEERSLTSGSTNIPILEIVKWVERPAALTDDAPAIATNTPAPAPAQTAPAQAAQPGGSF